mgnify:CR=1 FL=1
MEHGAVPTPWYEAKLEQVKNNKETHLDLRRCLLGPGDRSPRHQDVGKDSTATDTDTNKPFEPRESQQLFFTMLRIDFSDLSNHLLHLDLAENALRTLCLEICDLHQLRTLELRDNRITSIPPDIEKLSKLQHLGLRNNLLATLPPELG